MENIGQQIILAVLTAGFTGCMALAAWGIKVLVKMEIRLSNVEGVLRTQTDNSAQRREDFRHD